MFQIAYAAQSGTPTPQEHSEQPSKSKKSFNKKLFVPIVAIITIIVVAVALLIPQGSATIQLNVNYNVGEKMIYNTTDTTTSSNVVSSNNFQPKSTTSSGQEIMDVLSFDGQTYTINDTVTMTIAGLTSLTRPLSISTIEEINKTGYERTFLTFLNTTTELPSNGLNSNQDLEHLLSAPEVKVGDTITIPEQSLLASSPSPNFETTGYLTLTFKGFQDLTVPAGTYRVFEVDLVSHDVSTTMKLQLPEITPEPTLPLNLSLGNYPTPQPSITPHPTTITTTSTMNATQRTFIEVNTIRLIQTTTEDTFTDQTPTANYTTTSISETTLNQDINPQ
ncbi:MAG: hypothetical protein ACLQO7_10430 [Candidatus Bathyarchaeia archaeon]